MSGNLTLESLNKDTGALRTQQDVLTGAADALLLIVSGVAILNLQGGFALLEVGCIKVTNVNEILLNNIIDLCVCTISYVLLGFGLSFGESGGGFLGTTHLALTDYDNIAWIFFQFTFAATVTAIVSSVMVGRTCYRAYLIYTAITTGIVYPVVVHWTWSGEGWMSKGPGGLQFQDFAGSSIVHGLGGICGVCASAVLGKRKLQADIVDIGSIPPSAPALVTLGYFILFNGCLYFNCASVGAISGFGDSNIIAKVLMNTALSSASGCITTIIVQEVILGVEPGYWLLLSAVSGGLAGCVSICASCDVASYGGAVIIGGIGGALSMIWAKMFHKTGLEDPCDSTAVHLCCGIWGTFAAPLFDSKRGFFYTGSAASMRQFGWNILCCLVIMLWGISTMFPVYKVLDVLGVLRAAHEKLEHKLALELEHEADEPGSNHEMKYAERSFLTIEGSSHMSTAVKKSQPEYKTACVSASPSDFAEEHLKSVESKRN